LERYQIIPKISNSTESLLK